jgi:putative nucleotidyltransferase with HDIG domain
MMVGHRNTPLVIRAYVLAVALLAGVALLAAFRFYPVSLSGVRWSGVAAFALLGLGLQVAQLRLAVGAVHGSISFIVYLAAALVFGPTWAALITGISIGAAQLIARKQPLKILFNVGQHVLAVVVGSTVYLLMEGPLLRPGQAQLDLAVVPFIFFVIVFFALNSIAVSGAVALSEDRPFAEVWMRNTWGLAVYDLIASTLAIGVAWLYVELDLLGLALVVLPLVFLRHTYLVNLQLQETNRELLALMVKAIEARDPYTSGHSQRVAELARALAKDIGLTFQQAEEVATAALLHDVGKIYEEFAPLLRKPGKLTDEERLLMQTHVERSAELVGTISNLRGRIQKYVRHHHERFDGSGYPDGLAGQGIPIGARLIMVADTTDAMTTDRPYRSALGFDDVIAELRRCAGGQFDPDLVDAFCQSAAVRRVINTWRLRPRSQMPRGEDPSAVALMQY